MVPSWWTGSLAADAQAAAAQALPNEVCGLVYRIDAKGAILHCFGGSAAPDSCVANPQEVVDFAYELQEYDRKVVATFHTHPNGSSRLSARDAVLADWASLHLVLYLAREGWRTVCWSIGADPLTL